MPLLSRPAAWTHTRTLRALVLAVICAVNSVHCGAGAPRPAPLGRPSASGQTSSSGAQHSPLGDQTAATTAQVSGPPLPNAFCSASLDDPQRSVASIDGRSVTQCEVLLLAVWALREGLTVATPQGALEQWITLELLSLEARRRGLAQEPATTQRQREVLAAAVIRAEARAGFSAPDAEQIAAYYRTHQSEFAQDTRVHVRAIGVRTERAARALITQLQASGAREFAALAQTRSVLPNAARDSGDLGLLSLDNAYGVPDPVVRAAFLLTDERQVAAQPVRVTTMIAPPSTASEGTARRHRRRARRRRPQRTTVFWVVQRLERIEGTTPALPAVARRIAARLEQEQWQQRLPLARESVLTAARANANVTINDQALRLVRIETTAH